MEEGRAGPPSRAALVAVLVPIGLLVVASQVADALTTSWAEDNPLPLLALNARNRILVLTTNQLDPLSYYGVGMLRNLVSDPLFYLLGVWYGDGAIRWLEKRSPTYGELARKLERGFGKAAYPLVVVAPNNWICLFAGAAGMSIPLFFGLNILGMVGRLVIIRLAGDVFSGPIDSVLDFFAQYRLQLFVVSIALVLLSMALQRRSGVGEIGALRDLEREATADADDGA